MAFQNAIFQWENGRRRLEEAEAADRPALERATDRIVRELRRRLGSAFTTDELADLYAGGTDWAQDIAMTAAPTNPRAWQAETVTDAAFAKYVREATDFAGGRRL